MTLSSELRVVGGAAGPRPARSRRARENDRALLDAAVRLTTERGWADLTFAAVAAAAGLTTRPLYDRFGTMSALAVRVWSDRIASEVGILTSGVLDAASTLERRADGSALRRAWQAFADAGRTLPATPDLLIAAQFDELLADAVLDTVRPLLASLPAVGGEAGPTRAAVASHALAVGLGLMVVGRRPGAVVTVGPVVDATLAALGAPVAPRPLPEVDLPALRQLAVDTGDPALDALLTATLDEVADLGYRAATTARIAAAAGSSQGLLYSRYGGKLDLVVDASRRWNRSATAQLDSARGRLAAEIGAGAADAVLARAWMRPEHRTARALALEQERVGWYRPEVRAVTTEVESAAEAQALRGVPHQDRAAATSRARFAVATAFGHLLLPTLAPHAWSLPLDVVLGALAPDPTPDRSSTSHSVDGYAAQSYYAE